MSTISNDPTDSIAFQLRSEREARGWSLADLAERGDIAGAGAAEAEVAALGDGVERHLAAEAGDELLGAGAEDALAGVEGHHIVAAGGTQE